MEADRDGQHQMVEVARLQHHVAHVGPAAPARLEIEGSVVGPVPQGLALHQLPVVRDAGPAGQPLDVDQRRIGRVAAEHVHLAFHAHAADTFAAPPVGLDFERLDAVEELEGHAAPFQHLVVRREDGVAHAGLHAPHEGATVFEAHPQDRVQRGAGGGVLETLAGAPAREPERQVVVTTQQRRVETVGMAAVVGQELAQLASVQCRKRHAARHHAFLEQAHQRGTGNVEHMRQPARMQGRCRALVEGVVQRRGQRACRRHGAPVRFGMRQPVLARVPHRVQRIVDDGLAAFDEELG